MTHIPPRVTVRKEFKSCCPRGPPDGPALDHLHLAWLYPLKFPQGTSHVDPSPLSGDECAELTLLTNLLDEMYFDPFKSSCEEGFLPKFYKVK